MKTGVARLQLTLRALRHRNYRLFFFGQGISLIGTWMTQVTLIWLVYHLTSSTLILGLVAFISQSPGFFLPPVAGYLCDRWNRHRILIITQTVAMIRSLVLAVLTLSDWVNIWHLVLLGFLQGIVSALELPTRQAFTLEMVETKEDLDNAIALNSSLLGSARLVGPAIAGLLIASVGAGICFLLDGISYIAVLIALLAMRIKPKRTIKQTSFSWQELKIGCVYAFTSKSIRSILLLLALVNLMGTPFIALGPVFARDILRGGSQTFGFLMTASAIGALIGAIYLSFRSGMAVLKKAIVISPIILGIGLMFFSQSHYLWFSLLSVCIIGLFLIIQNAASNTIIQMIVDDDKRGRVMGLYTIASDAMIPLGNLLAGGLAICIGAPNTLLVEGIFCLLSPLILFL